MFQSTEIFVEMIQFLHVKDMVNLYDADLKYADLFHDIKRQFPNFAIPFNYTIRDYYVKWFKKHKISVSLFCQYHLDLTQ